MTSLHRLLRLPPWVHSWGLSLGTLVLVLCLMTLFTTRTECGGSTSEARMAHDLAFFSRMYTEKHEGQQPTTWEDLQQSMNAPVDEVYHYILPTRRYAFLPQPVPLPGPDEGSVYLITRRPFREHQLRESFFDSPMGPLRRYIICRDPSGVFFARIVTEEYVQRLFRDKPSLLPAPDTEPMRVSEVSARRAWVLYCAEMIGFILLALYVLPRLAGLWSQAARAAHPEEGAASS